MLSSSLKRPVRATEGRLDGGGHDLPRHHPLSSPRIDFSSKIDMFRPSRRWPVLMNGLSLLFSTRTVMTPFLKLGSISSIKSAPRYWTERMSNSERVKTERKSTITPRPSRSPRQGK